MRGRVDAAPPHPRSPEHRPDGLGDLHGHQDELEDGRDDSDDLDGTVRVGRGLSAHRDSLRDGKLPASFFPPPMRDTIGSTRPPDG